MAPELLLLGVLLTGISAYALLAGADFGAGVWELVGGVRRRAADETAARERELTYRAIGPVWEANHVWLIFVLAGLWTGFPPAFAALCRALWAPLLLALVGIVFRGAAYAFRAHSTDPAQRTLWETVFAFASTLAPFFLGASAGAIASGRLDLTGQDAGSWLNVTSLFGGCFAVAACGHLTAVYLTREAAVAGDEVLRERWRRRGLGAGVAMGVLSVGGLAVVAVNNTTLWAGFRARAWPVVLVSALGGCLSLVALLRRRHDAAAGGAAVALGSVVWGWGLAQFPLLIPPGVSVTAAKAPDEVLWTMLGVMVCGSLLLAPSLVWLFVLFKRGPAEPVSAVRSDRGAS